MIRLRYVITSLETSFNAYLIHLNGCSTISSKALARRYGQNIESRNPRLYTKSSPGAASADFNEPLLVRSQSITPPTMELVLRQTLKSVNNIEAVQNAIHNPTSQQVFLDASLQFLLHTLQSQINLQGKKSSINKDITHSNLSKSTLCRPDRKPTCDEVSNVPLPSAVEIRQYSGVDSQPRISDPLTNTFSDSGGIINNMYTHRGLQPYVGIQHFNFDTIDGVTDQNPHRPMQLDPYHKPKANLPAMIGSKRLEGLCSEEHKLACNDENGQVNMSVCGNGTRKTSSGHYSKLVNPLNCEFTHDKVLVHDNEVCSSGSTEVNVPFCTSKSRHVDSSGSTGETRLVRSVFSNNENVNVPLLSHKNVQSDVSFCDSNNGTSSSGIPVTGNESVDALHYTTEYLRPIEHVQVDKPECSNHEDTMRLNESSCHSEDLPCKKSDCQAEYCNQNRPVCKNERARVNRPVWQNVTSHVNKPVYQLESARVNKPVWQDNGSDLSKPDLQVKSSCVNRPVWQNNGSDLSKPDRQVKSSCVNRPVWQNNGSDLSKPDLQVKRSCVNRPVWQNNGSDLSKPDLQVKSSCVNIPVWQNNGSDLSKPDLQVKRSCINRPVWQNNGFDLSKPDLQAESTRVNRPAWQNDNVHVNESLTKDGYARINGPDCQSESANLNRQIRQTENTLYMDNLVCHGESACILSATPVCQNESVPIKRTVRSNENIFLNRSDCVRETLQFNNLSHQRDISHLHCSNSVGSEVPLNKHVYRGGLTVTPVSYNDIVNANRLSPQGTNASQLLSSSKFFIQNIENCNRPNVIEKSNAESKAGKSLEINNISVDACIDTREIERKKSEMSSGLSVSKTSQCQPNRTPYPKLSEPLEMPHTSDPQLQAQPDTQILEQCLREKRLHAISLEGRIGERNVLTMTQARVGYPSRPLLPNRISPTGSYQPLAFNDRCVPNSFVRPHISGPSEVTAPASLSTICSDTPATLHDSVRRTHPDRKNYANITSIFAFVDPIMRLEENDEVQSKRKDSPLPCNLADNQNMDLVATQSTANSANMLHQCQLITDRNPKQGVTFISSTRPFHTALHKDSIANIFHTFQPMAFKNDFENAAQRTNVKCTQDLLTNVEADSHRVVNGDVLKRSFDCLKAIPNLVNELPMSTNKYLTNNLPSFLPRLDCYTNTPAILASPTTETYNIHAEKTSANATIQMASFCRDKSLSTISEEHSISTCSDGIRLELMRSCQDSVDNTPNRLLGKLSHLTSGITQSSGFHNVDEIFHNNTFESSVSSLASQDRHLFPLQPCRQVSNVVYAEVPSDCPAPRQGIEYSAYVNRSKHCFETDLAYQDDMRYNIVDIVTTAPFRSDKERDKLTDTKETGGNKMRVRMKDVERSCTTQGTKPVVNERTLPKSRTKTIRSRQAWNGLTPLYSTDGVEFVETKRGGGGESAMYVSIVPPLVAIRQPHKQEFKSTTARTVSRSNICPSQRSAQSFVGTGCKRAESVVVSRNNDIDATVEWSNRIKAPPVQNIVLQQRSGVRTMDEKGEKQSNVLNLNRNRTKAGRQDQSSTLSTSGRICPKFECQSMFKHPRSGRSRSPGTYTQKKQLRNHDALPEFEKKMQSRTTMSGKPIFLWQSMYKEQKSSSMSNSNNSVSLDSPKQEALDDTLGHLNTTERRGINQVRGNSRRRLNSNEATKAERRSISKSSQRKKSRWQLQNHTKVVFEQPCVVVTNATQANQALDYSRLSPYYQQWLARRHRPVMTFTPANLEEFKRRIELPPKVQQHYAAKEKRKKIVNEYADIVKLKAKPEAPSGSIRFKLKSYFGIE